MDNSRIERRDLLPAIFWIGIGIFVMIFSIELGIGMPSKPGPGMFPFMLGAILTSISALVFAFSLRHCVGPKEKISIWKAVDIRKPASVVIVIFAYGLILDRLGFVLTTFLCLFVLFRFVGSFRIYKSLLATLLVLIAAYIVFIYLLNLYVPSFPWRAFLDAFS